jgi:DNA repair protein RecO (recombination protein O)
MALIKTEAIVIKAADYSESTRLVTLFSPDQGKIRVMAKGVRRMQSRERGSLEPFSRVQATVYLKGPDSLGTLKEASPIANGAVFRNDYDCWLLGSVVLEVIDRSSHPGEEEETSYQIVCDYLHAMEELATTPKDSAAPAAGSKESKVRQAERLRTARELTTIALLQLLAAAGFSPQFDRCGTCESPGPIVGFHVDPPGVSCGECVGKGRYFHPLPPGTIKVMERLASEDPSARRNLRVSSPQLDAVFRLAVDLLQYHLDISLTSARMLASLPSSSNGHGPGRGSASVVPQAGRS